MHVGPSSLGMQYTQQTNILVNDKNNHLLPPTTVGSSQDRSGHGGHSLMGGLMNGLRRIPTALRFGGGKKLNLLILNLLIN